MNISAQQLRDLHEAYVVGRLKPMQETTEKDSQIGVDDIESTVIAAEERDLLLRCGRYGNAALKASRQGKYGIADYLFAAVEDRLQGEVFSHAGRLIAYSAYESARSYLDYRRGLFEIGTQRIYHAMTCDEALDKAYGLVLFHIHRIRLILNLVRLKRRQGEVDEALSMSLAVMHYLEQKIPTLPFPTTWDARRLNNAPLTMRNILFEHTVWEIMYLTVGQPIATTALSSAFSMHTCTEASPTCQLSAHSHLWLQAQQELWAERPERFLELVLPLVEAGPEGALWLWYGIAIDLVLLCKDLELEPAHQLMQTIAEDMLSWRWSSLPPAWKRVSETISLHAYA